MSEYKQQEKPWLRQAWIGRLRPGLVTRCAIDIYIISARLSLDIMYRPSRLISILSTCQDHGSGGRDSILIITLIQVVRLFILPNSIYFFTRT